ncbi:hypothetical protein EDB81DRAFT_695608, partial [Dactylonectria macrodidyma]
MVKKMYPHDDDASEFPGESARPYRDAELDQDDLIPQQPAGNIPDISPDDTVIAIMGMTGVGKSTFISHFNNNALVGDSLMSCTTAVGIHEARIQAGMGEKRFFLIDTPGFDDSTRSDTDVLRELADWLSRSYQANIKLAGIIYLHRIGDPRMGGAAMKNLRMFRKLCGDQGLSSVVLATTFWSRNPTLDEIRREKELISRDDFWGAMIRKGSTLFRQDDGTTSATKIIQFIFSQRSRFTLEIQEEMAHGKTLDQTSAGLEVQAEMDMLRAMHEKELKTLRVEMEEARKKNDLETQREIAGVRAEVEKKMKEEEAKREALRVGMEELQRQREDELREERQRMWEREKEHSNAMWESKMEMERLKNRGEYELKLIEANHQAALKDAELRRYQLEEEERRRKQQEDVGCTIM